MPQVYITIGTKTNQTRDNAIQSSTPKITGLPPSDIQQYGAIKLTILRSVGSQGNISLEPTVRRRKLPREPLSPRNPCTRPSWEIFLGGAEVVQGALIQAVGERGDIGDDLHVSKGASYPEGIYEVDVAKDFEREG